MRMKIMKAGFVVAVIAIGVLLPSSSGNSTNNPPPGESASQLVNDGWQAFAGQNYTTALSKFTAALRLDATLVDGYNGAGWSDIRLNLLDNATTEFNAGKSRDTTNVDIWAGLAFVNNAQKNYTASIADAQSVLQKNTHWFFERDTTVNIGDVKVALAEDYFSTASFDLSLAAVQSLDASFRADVSTLAGQAALAQEIETLRNIYN
jgi:hypothetical protein